MGAALVAASACLVTASPALAWPAPSPVPSWTYATGGGEISAMVSSGNRVYLGGSFETLGPFTGAGVPVDPADGSAIGQFPQVTGSAEITAVVDDGAGGYFIGGSFTNVGGLPRHNLAHITADGQVDAGWQVDTDGTVFALARSGARLYVGGGFGSVGGKPRFGIAQVDATTGTVTGWDPDVEAGTIAVAGNVVYVGGQFTAIGATPRNRIAALDADTGAVLPWNPDANGPVSALAVSGGTVYAGGSFTQIGLENRNRLAALDAGSGAATSWNPDADGAVSAIGLRGSSIYVGGQFTHLGGATRSYIGALDATTGAPTSWDPEADAEVTDLLIVGSSVYVGGYFHTLGGEPRRYAGAADADTGAVTGWSPSPDKTVRALAFNGRSIYVAGDLTSVGAVDRNGLAAIDTRTGLITPWDPAAGPRGSVDVLALALSGSTLYVGGFFQTIGGQPRNRLAAVSTSEDTNNVTGWNPNADEYVTALAVSGQTVYVAGFFTHIGGIARHYLAAIDAVTGQPTAADPNPNDTVTSLAADGSNVYVGGLFTQLGGQPRHYLAALDGSSGAVTGWNPNPPARVFVVAPADQTVYVDELPTAGHPSALAAYDATSGLADPWDPGLLDATISPDGRAWIAPAGERVFVGNRDVDAVTGQAHDWNPSVAPVASVRTGMSPVPTVFVGSLGAVSAYPPLALPSSTERPTVTGAALVGHSLTCAAGSWTGATRPLTEQWLRDDSPVDTGTTHAVTSDDVGHALSCVVSATNDAGTTNAASYPVYVASPGPPGTPGSRGPTGPPGPRSDPALILAAFVNMQRHRIIVHYAVTGSARLTLSIHRPHGRTWIVATRAVRRRGSGTITWNRKLGRRVASHGAYTLTLTATSGKRRARVIRHLRI